jgi:hypothetical protein
LAQDIKRWLPPATAPKFLAFHNQFVGYFHSNLDADFNWCLNCKTQKEAALCPYCYTNEVIYWLKAKSPVLANRFAQLFPFDFERVGHKPVFRTNSEPIEGVKEKSHFGICDSCGEYSEKLVSVDGEWHCESCVSV